VDVPLSVWLSAAALIGSVGLIWVAVGGAKSGQRARDALASAGASDFRGLSLARPARERLSSGVLGQFGATMRRFTPAGVANEADRRILRAGLSHRWTAERLLATKFLLGIGIFLFFFLWSLSSGDGVYLLLGVLLGGVGFVLPDLVIIRMGESRSEQIRDDLADVVDQIVISVEAGLSFDSALERVARNGDGPLERELQRVLQDIALGMSRRDALMALTDRTDVEDLRELLLALVHSEEHGLPIGRVLRVQSEEIRDKRKFRAEERAMKIPVKIVFPLILCILPCIAAVIVGPAIVRITQNFGENL